MKKPRPVNLNLATIHFPVTAIVSILHRVSGVIMMITLGAFLWLLGLSLSSAEGFQQAAEIVKHLFIKFLLWGVLTALLYHMVSGCRHLLMDIGWLAETRQSGQRSAWGVLVLTVILSVGVAGVIC
ncbi:MAG: Succinate dehydrogenase cytochrome b556 subunit [Candidatus Erwinia impunctatus]|nr:Succinate dehydrogenase cytochrome b556 subunit [Culicoides impunctatus]